MCRPSLEYDAVLIGVIIGTVGSIAANFVWEIYKDDVLRLFGIQRNGTEQ